MKRVVVAVTGFCLGLFTLPLVVAAWPFVAAYMLMEEEDR